MSGSELTEAILIVARLSNEAGSAERAKEAANDSLALNADHEEILFRIGVKSDASEGTTDFVPDSGVADVEKPLAPLHPNFVDTVLIQLANARNYKSYVRERALEQFAN